MSVRALLFDHTVLRSLLHPERLEELRRLLWWLRENGLRWAVLATHPRDLGSVREALRSASLALPDLELSREDVPGKKAKGSPEWIRAAEDRLELEPHQLVYVGDDEWAWKTALNGGVAYLHAEWSRPPDEKITSAIAIGRPDDLPILLEHLFLRPPQWRYRIDLREDARLHLRCLLDAGDNLPGDLGDFRLQDILTRHRTDLTVGGLPAYHLLMLHAMSNLYLEGLIQPGTYFCVYPGHLPESPNPILESFMKPATAFFSRAYFRSGWLRRFREAPDTSLMRRERQPVSFLEQTNTVCLDAGAQKALSRNPRVIVFDDFTTTGTSLDWARNLLDAGGARQVILVAIGKYGKDHQLIVPRPGVSVRPFHEARYGDSDFDRKPISISSDPSVSKQLQSKFELWKRNSPRIRIWGV